MAKKVFISYCHKQENWVFERLLPCLKAGGTEVLIDKERFRAGRSVIGQMDAFQDKAEASVLVLSQDYLNSKSCQHEMKRAIQLDPHFRDGKVIPILYSDCTLPGRLKKALYIDLRDDKNSQKWELLLQACKADLGTTAPDWLDARDNIVRYLQRKDSVNLVISGHPKWRELICHIQEDFLPGLGIVDLESGGTASRRGLVSEILKAFCGPVEVPPEPEDLVTLNNHLSNQTYSQLAIFHCDLIPFRPAYDVNLFAALRNLSMDSKTTNSSKKLSLITISKNSFPNLLPKEHPLSSLDLKVVELKGKP